MSLLSKLKQGDLFKGDKVIWMIYFLLCMISLVEVYSASSRLTFDSASHIGPMISQAAFLMIGFMVILVVHRMPCRGFMALSYLIFPLAIGFLFFSAVLKSGGTINATNRWVYIGSFSVQPSEFAKAALVMITAVILAKSQAENKVMVNGKEKIVVGAIKGKPYKAFATVSALTLFVCGLIFMDNISTAAILFVVILCMMFIARVPARYIIKGLGSLFLIGTFAGSILIQFDDATLLGMPGLKRVVTLKHRINRSFGLHIGEHEEMANNTTAMVNGVKVTLAGPVGEYKSTEGDNLIQPSTGRLAGDTLSKTEQAVQAANAKVDRAAASRDSLIAAYNDSIQQARKDSLIADLFGDYKSQTTYANIAVANSKGIGLGPGNSIERDFLQHAESDFIFAIIIEEMGLFGAFFVIFLYVVLLIRVGRIANKSDRFFSAYLVMGLGIMMVLQAIVNMAVAVDLIPVTGQTLPLISKGGSSILVTSFYFGMILSVSRYNERVEMSKKEQEALQAQIVETGETNEYLNPGSMV